MCRIPVVNRGSGFRCSCMQDLDVQIPTLALRSCRDLPFPRNRKRFSGGAGRHLSSVRCKDWIFRLSLVCPWSASGVSVRLTFTISRLLSPDRGITEMPPPSSHGWHYRSLFSHGRLFKKNRFLLDLIRVASVLSPHPHGGRRLRLCRPNPPSPPSTPAYGGGVLVDPVPVYFFFGIVVPTSRGCCTRLYFQSSHPFTPPSHHGSPRSSSRFPPYSLGPSDSAPAGCIGSCGVHLGQ